MKKSPHRAFDTDGKQLDMTPEEVKAHSARLLVEGDLLLVMSRLNGDISVNVMGAPSLEIFEALQQAVEGYKRALMALGLIQ